MKVRNTLGDAYLAAYEATDLAASITLVLDCASERPQLGINDDQRRKIEDMFRRLHLLVCQADVAVYKALDAQPPVQPVQPTGQRAGHAGDARRKGAR